MKKILITALAVGIFAGYIHATQEIEHKFIEEIANKSDSDVTVELVYPEAKPLIETREPKKAEALKPIPIITVKKQTSHKFSPRYEVIPSMGEATIHITFAYGTKPEDIGWKSLRYATVIVITKEKILLRGSIYGFGRDLPSGD